MSNHIVHRIRFDLKVGSRERALGVQDAASRFVAQALPAILERRLAGLAAEDRVIAFDRLDLQLGTLPARDFEALLPARIENALADALFVARHARARDGSALVRETPAAVRRSERLLDFLDHGLFAPPEDSSEPATPAALLEAELESDPEAARRLAIWWRHRPHRRRRLASQFSDAALLRLVGAVSASSARGVGVLLEALRRATRAGPGPEFGRSVRAAAWEAILAVVLGSDAREPPLAVIVARAVEAALAASTGRSEALEAALRAGIAGSAATVSEASVLLAALAAAGAAETGVDAPGDAASPDRALHVPRRLADAAPAAAEGAPPSASPRWPAAAPDPAASEPAALRSAARDPRSDESRARESSWTRAADRLRAARDRGAMIDALVDREPVRFRLHVLRTLAPSYAGFLETLLMAVAQVEAALPPPRSDGRAAWRIALRFALEEDTTRDLGRLVEAILAAMAAARALPPPTYRDLVAAQAQGRAARRPRYAPLLEVVATLREAGAAATGPRDQPTTPAPPAFPEVAPGRSVARDLAAPSSETAVEEPDSEREPRIDAEAIAYFLWTGAPGPAADTREAARFFAGAAAVLRASPDGPLWPGDAWPMTQTPWPGFAARLRALFESADRAAHPLRRRDDPVPDGPGSRSSIAGDETAESPSPGVAARLRALLEGADRAPQTGRGRDDPGPTGPERRNSIADDETTQTPRPGFAARPRAPLEGADRASPPSRRGDDPGPAGHDRRNAIAEDGTTGSPQPAIDRLLAHLRGDIEVATDERRALGAIAFRSLRDGAADLHAALESLESRTPAAPRRLMALLARAASARDRETPVAASQADEPRRGDDLGPSRRDGPPWFGREIDVLVHLLAFADRPWWDGSASTATVESRLRDALETDPARTVAALRRLEPGRVADALLRYVPLEGLRRLADHLQPDGAARLVGFPTIASPRTAAFDQALAAARWRTGLQALLSEPPAGAPDRLAATAGPGLERDLGLPRATLEAIDRDLPRHPAAPTADAPGAADHAPPRSIGQEPRPAASATSSPERRPRSAGGASETADLFGPPVAIDDDSADPLLSLRHLLRYGRLPSGRGGVDAIARAVEPALSRFPADARPLILAAMAAPLPRRTLAQLPTATLRRIGRLVFLGENHRAFAFVEALLRADALSATGAGPVAWDALFADLARTGRAIRPVALVDAALGAVAAFEGRKRDAALASWRDAIGRLDPPSDDALHMLRALRPEPVVRRAAAPSLPVGRDRDPGAPAIRVRNAGVVLLAPHFGALFERLDLLDGRLFRGEQARATAVDLLEYLVFGVVETREYELTLDKILCGMAPEEPLAAGAELEERARELCDGLLRSTTQSWVPLKNSSIATLREAFLQREGILTRGEDQWILKVAAKPYDMLLDSLPWPYRMIKTRWMAELVQVAWR